MHKIIFSLFILTLLIMGGCASKPHARSDLKIDAWPDTRQQDENMAWWSIQFVKQWPKNTSAPFNYDVLLAEKVIRPALIKFHGEISLWRFHRRAVRDAAGSKFSFIFYASADDAQIISDHIASDPLIKEMSQSGLIEKVWTDDFSKPKQTEIGDTSDAKWPPEIQNSWPYFIMGVSQSWLALINELSSREPLDMRNASLDEAISYYTEISEQIDSYWEDNARHAYIHHLSALFAYRPIRMKF